MKKIAITLLTALSLTCTASFAQPLSSAPIFAVGTSWTYKVEDLSTNQPTYTYKHTVQSVTDSSATLIGEVNKPDESRKYVLLYDMAAAKILKSYKYSEEAPLHIAEQTADRSENESDVRFPLVVGDKYSVKQALPWSSSVRHDNWDAKVVSYESVETDAGTFQAYKIELEGFFTIENRKDAIFQYKAKKTIWYAPEVGREVKIVYQDYGVRNRYQRIHYVVTTLSNFTKI